MYVLQILLILYQLGDNYAASYDLNSLKASFTWCQTNGYDDFKACTIDCASQASYYENGYLSFGSQLVQSILNKEVYTIEDMGLEAEDYAFNCSND